MLERLSKSNRNLALVAVAAILLWFGWNVRAVLNPLILGYLLAYILRPLVQSLENRGIGRRAAVNVIFSLFGIAILIGGGALLIQARAFVVSVIQTSADGTDPFTRAERRIDGILGDASDWFDEIAGSIPFGDDEGEPGESGAEEPGPAAAASDGDGAEDSVPAEGGAPEPASALPGASGPEGGSTATIESSGDGSVDSAAQRPAETTLEGQAPPEHKVTLRNLIRAWIDQWSKGIERDGGSGALVGAQLVVQYLQRIFGGVMSIFGVLFLLPVYTYFLLFELERIHGFVRRHIPKRERTRMTRIGRGVGAVIANFFRGRLLICLLKGLVMAAGLSLMGVPYGFLLGIMSGFLSLIPFVGPTFGFGFTVVIALQRLEFLEALLMIGPLFVLAELLEGYVFIPKILGDSLGLHPVVILLSVFVGGAALGFFGFLIAIPLAAVGIILFRELVMPAIEDFAEEDSHVEDSEPSGAPG